MLTLVLFFGIPTVLLLAMGLAMHRRKSRGSSDNGGLAARVRGTEDLTVPKPPPGNASISDWGLG
ncbi:hypothetical protein [Streptomyces sp. TR06-5]|uniref:hypothetical protein n=1 Tax=unclassified Streptomyces TaxID=2593676 RepID=UPI00399F1846